MIDQFQSSSYNNNWLSPYVIFRLNSSKNKMRYLEKLSLHISWNQLYTHPTKINIDGFYLLVEPNTEVKYNAEREEKKEYDAKMKEVHKVEEFRKEREEYGKINIIFFSC